MKPNVEANPLPDYRGTHVIDINGRLATIVRVYRCRRVACGAWLAALQRFNGEDAGEQPLASLEILERDHGRG